ncbi:MAG: phosphotransferase [Haloechinothrix sp.]
MSLDISSAGDERLGNGANSEMLDAALSAAEVALANRFGASITLAEPEDLAGSGPAVVARVTVDSSPFSLPSTLVIKHYPGARSQPTDPFAAEAASYQLFTALPTQDRSCPDLIGHDGKHRVLVLEDLGRAPTLEDKLRVADSRAAESALLSWARALGRMHAATATREQDFNALRRRLGASAADPDDATSSVCQQLPAMLLEFLGISTSSAMVDVATEATQRVSSPEFRAFSPVDLSPDNNLVTTNGVRFLDFEHGCVRNALIDVAHLRAPFAFWDGSLALPAGMSEAMIAAWRAEVTGVWPALDDDEVLGNGLLDSQLLAVWVQTWETLPGLFADPDTGPTSRAAALVSWWRELARHAQLSRSTEITDHASAVAESLDQRFGPGLKLAVYEAFR